MAAVLVIAMSVLAGCAGALSTGETPTAWVDPSHRLEVAFPGEPSPREAQELHGMGAINFTVWAVNGSDGSAYRAYAFLYPGEVPGLTHFDPEGELDHSVGVQVARMSGSIESDTRVTVDGLPGREVVFGVTNEAGQPGHGILRMILRFTPPTRHQAWCVAPDESFERCIAFVRSLRPLVH